VKPKEEYYKISKSSAGYVHIDVIKPTKVRYPEVYDRIRDAGYIELSDQVKVAIHDHMYELGLRDPRRKSEMDRKGKDHYELWNADENFSPQAFGVMVRGLNTMRDVRIVWIWNNEAHTRIFRTLLLEDAVNRHAPQLT